MERERERERERRERERERELQVTTRWKMFSSRQPLAYSR